MGLIITIEDHFAVVFENGGKSLPERLEAGVVGDDVVVVAAEIVRVDDGVGTLGGYVVDVVYEGRLVGCVGGASHGGGDNALHHDWDTWLC